MMIHWLDLHSFQSAFQVVLLSAGAVLSLSGVFFLLDALNGGKWVSARGSILGIVGGTLWMATALLESDPRRHHLGAVLLDAGMIPLLFYATAFTRRRRASIALPSPEPEAAPGAIWPPPPTSHR